MMVLVDEAHGTHFYFEDSLPLTAMEAGADIEIKAVYGFGYKLVVK